jgi:hypothetical protein
MKIVLLIGLPGSGKTYLGTQMKKDGFAFVDDASRDDHKRELAHLSECFRTNRDKMDLVIADPLLCYPRTFNMAMTKLSEWFPGCEVECIYFENDLDKCMRNVERRNDGRLVDDLVWTLSKAYKIPEGVTSVPIWDGE